MQLIAFHWYVFLFVKFRYKFESVWHYSNFARNYLFEIIIVEDHRVDWMKWLHRVYWLNLEIDYQNEWNDFPEVFPKVESTRELNNLSQVMGDQSARRNDRIIIWIVDWLTYWTMYRRRNCLIMLERSASLIIWDWWSKKFER